MMPLMASAEKVEIDGIYYNLDLEAKTAEVTSNPNQYSGNIIIPENVSFENILCDVISIGFRAFEDCNGLTSVIIPNSVKKIMEGAFKDCRNLTSITFGSGLKDIYRDAFKDCTINAVHISDLKKWCEIDFWHDSRYSCNPLSYASHLYINGDEITDLVIPEGVTTIHDIAFFCCSFLSSVTIPNSVTCIGECAFSNCPGLQCVTSLAVNPPQLYGAFNNYDIPLFVPAGSVEAYKTTNPWSNFNNIYAIVNSFTVENKDGVAISYKFINDGTELEVAGAGISRSLVIPEEVDYSGSTYKVTGIGEKAFKGCGEAINSITFPKTLKKIGYDAFYECRLASVNLSDLEAWCNIEIDYYGSSPFEWGAPNLYLNGEEVKDLVIPNTVTNIKKYAFHNCRGITSVTIPSSVKTIGYMAFSNCNDLTSVLSLATTPPEMHNQSFFNNYDIPLYVPYASLGKYKDASGWSNFSNILAFDAPATKYKLTYKVDGEVYKTYELSEGDAITPEAAPTKEGYTFSGWSDIPSKMPTKDVTVTGTFTINKYKLIYKVDGAEYKKYEVEYGAAITPEAAPTKEGYTFSGWSEIPATMPAKDLTVTGSFTINKYKLIYKVDGAEYKKYEIEYGAKITPEPAPTKEGYSFSGWSTIPETMPANDVTITGTFSKGAYKLTYMVDGAVYKTVSYNYGDAITPEPAPTKEGYTFSGWSDIPKTMPAKDVIITGSFTKNEEQQDDPQTEITKEYVVYEIEGGTVSVTQSDNANGKVKIEGSVMINGKTYEVTIIAKEAFKGNTEMTSVDIPNSITSIGENAFEGCSGLRNIEIGSGIKVIASKAFANISKSSSRTRGNDDGLHLYCKASVVPATSSDVFEGSNISNATLHVPEDLVGTYKNVAPWNGFGTIVGLSTDIITISIDQSDVLIFDIQGNRLNNVRKGLNIIRTRDGNTKKIVLK